MNRLLFYLTLCFVCLVYTQQEIYAQSHTEFVKSFREAKRYLAQGEKRGEAIAILESLLDQDPGNSNVCYLLGVCHVLANHKDNRSVNYLTKALRNITKEYNPESADERKAPIYAYYYLVVAYAQNSKCHEAKRTFNKFQEVYGERNDLYTNDARNWVTACKGEDEPEVRVKKERNIVTKEVDYTTSSPLWGVQVGAYGKLIPIREAFGDLKNVEAFIDNQGIIRYVIGNFGTKTQAERLLEVVKENGYQDAFVVDVNKEGRYKNEVVIVNNRSFKAPLMGKVEYRVQLGAFRDVIPEELARIYLQIDGIKEYRKEGLTILTVGSWPSYEEATDHRNAVLELGVPGAFVVAFNRNDKITLDLARMYLDKKDR